MQTNLCERSKDSGQLGSNSTKVCEHYKGSHTGVAEWLRIKEAQLLKVPWTLFVRASPFSVPSRNSRFGITTFWPDTIEH